MQPVFVTPLGGQCFVPSPLPPAHEEEEPGPEMNVAISAMLDSLGLPGLSHAYELMHTASEVKGDAPQYQFFASVNPDPKASINPSKAIKPSGKF